MGFHLGVILIMSVFPPHRVGLIFSQFPCYDETFLLRETNALIKKGVDVTIFSIKPCRDQIVHCDAKPLLPLIIQSSYLFDYSRLL